MLKVNSRPMGEKLGEDSPNLVTLTPVLKSVKEIGLQTCERHLGKHICRSISCPTYMDLPLAMFLKINVRITFLHKLMAVFTAKTFSPNFRANLKKSLLRAHP
jgi:hypothetical protein